VWSGAVAALVITGQIVFAIIFPVKLRGESGITAFDYQVGMKVSIKPEFAPEDQFTPFDATIVAIDQPGDRLPIVTVRDAEGKKSDWLPGNIYPLEG
jgi:hypothetical protein